MAQPRTESAWLLVRKSPTLTDLDIIDATGVHPVTLAKMRQRRAAMETASIASRNCWALDSLPIIITP